MTGLATQNIYLEVPLAMIFHKRRTYIVILVTVKRYGHLILPKPKYHTSKRTSSKFLVSSSLDISWTMGGTLWRMLAKVHCSFLKNG